MEEKVLNLYSILPKLYLSFAIIFIVAKKLFEIPTNVNYYPENRNCKKKEK